MEVAILAHASSRLDLTEGQELRCTRSGHVGFAEELAAACESECRDDQ